LDSAGQVISSPWSHFACWLRLCGVVQSESVLLEKVQWGYKKKLEKKKQKTKKTRVSPNQ